MDEKGGVGRKQKEKNKGWKKIINKIQKKKKKREKIVKYFPLFLKDK